MREKTNRIACELLAERKTSKSPVTVQYERKNPPFWGAHGTESIRLEGASTDLTLAASLLLANICSSVADDTRGDKDIRTTAVHVCLSLALMSLFAAAEEHGYPAAALQELVDHALPKLAPPDAKEDAR